MSRCTLIFSIIAELLLAPAAFAKGAKPDKYQRCLESCSEMEASADKVCKQQSATGRCEGRAKAAFADAVKGCKAGCAKKKK